MEDLIKKLKKTLPTYTLTQPSTGKIISFRPMTVKEEKILLMSNQTGNNEDFLATIADVVERCFDVSDGKAIPLFDVEYFFLKLRSKSIGETVTPTLICPETGESVSISVNLEDVTPKLSKSHTKNIVLSSGLSIEMRYPNVQDLLDMKDVEFNYYDMLIKCITKIESDNELIETKNYNSELIQEFVDNLTKDQFQNLLNFFKTSPKIEIEVPYTTMDGVERTITLKGIRDFFQ